MEQKGKYSAVYRWVWSHSFGTLQCCCYVVSRTTLHYRTATIYTVRDEGCTPFPNSVRNFFGFLFGVVWQVLGFEG